MKYQYSAIIFLTLFLSGCMTARTNLNYQTNAPISVPSNGITVKVNNTKDGRSEIPGKIGDMYDQYGIDWGDVAEPKDLFDTLTKILKYELRVNGFEVVNEAPYDMEVSAKLNDITCTTSVASADATLDLHMHIKDQGEVVLDDEYVSSQEGRKFAWIGHEACNEAIKQTAESLMESFTTDLKDYIGN